MAQGSERSVESVVFMHPCLFKIQHAQLALAGEV